MQYSDIIIFVMEIIGTIAFAISGALIGVQKKMDLFGINVLGITTAVGGGLIRDLILGVNPPAMFRNSTYAMTAIVTSTIVFLWVYFKITSAICEIIADKKITKLIEQISDGYKILLGVLIAVLVMFIIGITLVLKMTNSSLMYR